jgi:hypothetical protein
MGVVAEHQLPVSTADKAVHLLKGDATKLDKAKLIGDFTGFSMGEGYPGGPEAGVAAEVIRNYTAERQWALNKPGGAMDMLRHGNEAGAVKAMEEVGMSPREINKVINKVESPKEEMSRKLRQEFEKRATPADERRLETVNR